MDRLQGVAFLPCHSQGTEAPISNAQHRRNPTPDAVVTSGSPEAHIAPHVGTHVTSIRNWEDHETTPALRFVPGIIRFMGYVTLPPGQSLPEELGIYRRVHGLSQMALAARPGVDEGTFRGAAAPLAHPLPQRRSLTSRARTSFRPLTKRCSMSTLRA